MTLRALLAFSSAAVVLAACSASDPRQVASVTQGPLSSQAARALDGKIAGTPVGCISSFQADAPLQLPNGGTAYRVSSTLTYVQDYGGQCAGVLDDNSYLIRRSALPQLCSGDIAQVVSRAGNFPIGNCVYSEFVPYRTPG